MWKVQKHAQLNVPDCRKKIKLDTLSLFRLGYVVTKHQ